MTLKIVLLAGLLLAASGCAMYSDKPVNTQTDGSYYGRTTMPMVIF